MMCVVSVMTSQKIVFVKKFDENDLSNSMKKLLVYHLFFRTMSITCDLEESLS